MSMKKFACLLLLIAFLAPITQAQESGVPSQRLAHLTRGINLPHWFWLPETENLSSHLTTYFTQQDAALLQASGINFVRLPVDVALFFDWEQPNTLKPEYIPALDAALNLLLAHDLAVIVTPFGDFDQRLSEGADGTPFWRLFATHLSAFDPERMFLMISNEPLLIPADWEPVREQLAAAIRSGAPDHTIIAPTPLRYGYTDNEWGTLEALLAMSPLDDPNVIYSVHFYEPFVFTHQGAEWTGWYSWLHGIPYPSTPENVIPAAETTANTITDPDLGWIPDVIRSYGNERWNHIYLEDRLRVAINWSNTHRVPLIVDEFGVYRYGGVNLADRINWLTDMRTLLEQYQIGWAMWDYAGGFSLATGDPGMRMLDPATAAALGLMLP
jgi:endoglucanase